MKPFDFHLRTRVLFGEGTLERLGELARELSFSRTLVVADRGIVATGQVARAGSLLEAAGIAPFFFHDFDANPDSRMVDAGRAFAAASGVDSIVAIGGGSSLDCAKGINFVLTNGGAMRDYQGFGKASRPMLPSIGIPTTAGTGSEAQSYALISDVDTHAKMACGDHKAAFRVAILDPAITISQPRQVTAIAGYDALSHAVESYVTRRGTSVSDLFAREAWRLLEGHFERVLAEPGDLVARAAMLLGAHHAGIAIEQSMLGATHACANPLTAHCGTAHGIAIAVMLPHVVRWNAEHVGDRYADLVGRAHLAIAGDDPRVESRPFGGLRVVSSRVEGRQAQDDPQPSQGVSPERTRGYASTQDGPMKAGELLARRLEVLRRAGELPTTLREISVPRDALASLAAEAATQWTGSFNPRPFDAAAALTLYENAY
jgi:alcohol dehydrogenase